MGYNLSLKLVKRLHVFIALVGVHVVLIRIYLITPFILQRREVNKHFISPRNLRTLPHNILEYLYHFRKVQLPI